MAQKKFVTQELTSPLLLVWVKQLFNYDWTPIQLQLETRQSYEDGISILIAPYNKQISYGECLIIVTKSTTIKKDASSN